MLNFTLNNLSIDSTYIIVTIVVLRVIYILIWRPKILYNIYLLYFVTPKLTIYSNAFVDSDITPIPAFLALHQYQCSWYYTNTSIVGITIIPVFLVLCQYQYSWHYTNTSILGIIPVFLVLHQYQCFWYYTNTSVGVVPILVFLVLHQYQYSWHYTNTIILCITPIPVFLVLYQCSWYYISIQGFPPIYQYSTNISVYTVSVFI